MILSEMKMKKLLILFAGLTLISACCNCPKASKEAAKAIEAANDFKTILHAQELFIQEHKSCNGELDKLAKDVVEKYKGNIAIDRTCNMMLRIDGVTLRAIADPMNGYKLYSCGPMGLYLTSEGFERHCGNIPMPFLNNGNNNQPAERTNNAAKPARAARK